MHDDTRDHKSKVPSSLLLDNIDATPAERDAAQRTADAVLALETHLLADTGQVYTGIRADSVLEALSLPFRRHIALMGAALTIAEEIRGGPQLIANIRRSGVRRPGSGKRQVA